MMTTYTHLRGLVLSSLEVDGLEVESYAKFSSDDFDAARAGGNGGTDELHNASGVSQYPSQYRSKSP